jgi:transposase-like protein
MAKISQNRRCFSQDRNGDFEPKVVPKYGKDISEQKIISMYARGMSTHQISNQVEEIYGFEVSENMVTSITNKLLPEIEAWQRRPLSTVYPIVFIDAIVSTSKTTMSSKSRRHLVRNWGLVHSELAIMYPGRLR